jgi:hypothetical protein
LNDSVVRELPLKLLELLSKLPLVLRDCVVRSILEL